MKLSKPFWHSLPERLLACAILVASLPMLLFVALLIRQFAGSPVLVSDESPGVAGAVCHCYRFRTTGHGTSSFHALGRLLRRFSFDEVPGLWSVACGNIRMRDFLRLVYDKSVS